MPPFNFQRVKEFAKLLETSFSNNLERTSGQLECKENLWRPLTHRIMSLSLKPAELRQFIY